jgi:hypothetical protein
LVYVQWEVIMVVRFVSDGFLKDDEERGVVVVWERKAEGDGVAISFDGV